MWFESAHELLTKTDEQPAHVGDRIREGWALP